MSGSRSNISGKGDRSSLDALSRTIEGLEARIEGLMEANVGREARQRSLATQAPAAENPAYPPRPRPETTAREERRGSEGRPDPFAQIRERQRALETSREQSYLRRQERVQSERQGAYGSQSAERPLPQDSRSASRSNPDAMAEIAQALVGLREDLKKDITEGMAREMNALKAEIRSIKSNAEDRNFAGDLRQDLARLAESIEQIGHPAAAPEAAGLKSEFEELRSLMDGLAREESVRGIENRWDGIEGRLDALDTTALQEELVSLAYRLDDIKRQLGGVNDSPAVHALEQKLISIATAMEQLGNLMQPQGQALTEQFSTIDTRLDEISRAIAATGRTTAAAGDPAIVQRLETRITALGEQMELVRRQTVQQPTDNLSQRLEALTLRVEELGNAAPVARLEERLDQLSALLEKPRTAPADPYLTQHLADISQKIDALEHGSVNDVLAERLDHLARRIGEIDTQAAPAPVMDDSAVYRLESRLADIAERLEASTAAAPTDTLALRNLEEQIAHLSLMISEPREQAASAGHDDFSAEFDRRMGALEDYMATNDEYIIEAARQAAQAVVEAYGRGGAGGASVPAADMSAIAALADDLRHLEEISRSSDERTHRTFEALHDTLVQIADRLDNLETRRPAARMPAAEYDLDPFAMAERATPAAPQPAMAAAAARPAPVIRTASPAAEQPVAASMAAAAASTAIDAATRAEIKAEVQQEGGRQSLFANLGKRFLSNRKGSAQAVPATDPALSLERPVIDPAPSIDPVDVVPSEEANELLEPGSGAPNVRKILERVRASQSRAGGAKAVDDGERADYIAAARRAAQAAAMEAGQADRLSGNGKKGGKAFSRYRRPILLAVGAALLAIMAFPLVNTLTHGRKAPADVAAVTQQAPATAPQAPAPQAAAPQAPVAANDAAAPTDGQSAATQPPAGQSALAPAAPDANNQAANPPINGANEAMTPPAGAPIDPGAPAAAGDVGQAAAPASPSATQAPAVAAQPAITVPDAIQPPALADAARKGDALALFEVGTLYTDGKGVPSDMKQAASWYQLSADRGFAPAQYRLASMYEKGNGIDRDLAKAKDYYEKAANAGNASAMHNLAVLYASGSAGPQDYNAAADWFTRAANLGVSDSQFNLAILYARGNGVKQDLVQSYKWFAIAAKSGDKDAAQKRDEVANALKPDQLNAARTEVDQWKPQPVDSRANSADIPDEWAGKGVHTASVDMKKAIRNIQAILNNNGFDAGQPDGTMGDKTVAALKKFQTSIGMQPDGKVTDKVVKELLARNK